MTNVRVFGILMMLAAAVLLSVGPLQAEGRCPQGMYPIGGQGVGGCAPIGGREGGGEVSAPQAAGRWLKTWGAIAVSHNGVAAAVKGQSSKAKASRSAIELCTNEGGDNCSVAFAYKNQCFAVVRTSKGRGDIFASESTLERATAAGLRSCRNTGGDICKVLHSDCTEPLFIRY